MKVFSILVSLTFCQLLQSVGEIAQLSDSVDQLILAQFRIPQKVHQFELLNQHNVELRDVQHFFMIFEHHRPGADHLGVLSNGRFYSELPGLPLCFAALNQPVTQNTAKEGEESTGATGHECCNGKFHGYLIIIGMVFGGSITAASMVASELIKRRF